MTSAARLRDSAAGSYRSAPAYPKYKRTMWEWPARLPAHWGALRLKNLARSNIDSLPEDADPEQEIVYVDIGSVSSDGVIENAEKIQFRSAPSRARRLVKSNDVLISTVRTYLRAIAHVPRVDNCLVASTGFAVLHARPGVESRFLYYLLRSHDFIERVVAYSEGVGYPAIAPSRLESLPAWLPEVDEQRRICAFLDSRTAEIDEFIAKKSRLIALIAERHAALIAQAVTNGLNRTAGRKPAGVNWVREIPAHWDIQRNKVLFRERDSRSVSGDEELLTVSHLTGVTRRSEKDVYMFEAETQEGYKRCEPGDLVINTMWAYMGALGVAKEAGIVSPAYNVYMPVNDRIAPDYFDLLCRTPQYVMEMTRFSKGIWKSRLRLYPEEFLNIRTCVPPLDEQLRIVEGLRGARQRFDALTSKAQSGIERLKEYRVALISAAVTGRIDVTSLI